MKKPVNDNVARGGGNPYFPGGAGTGRLRWWRPLLLLGALALPGARPLRAQAWDAPAARELVARAVARRAERDLALRAWSADARGTLQFLVGVGGGLLGGTRVVKVDQLATTLDWRAPGLTLQRIVGRRDTLLLPGDVGFYRDRYGVVTDNLGDRIRLGDGNDVRDLPHPLSPEGSRLHQFALADSLVLSLPGRQVEVYRLLVRPADPSAPGVVGTILLDRATAQVVRLALTFTPAAILDRRIERLTLTLENALVADRFWLPYLQQVEVVRGSRWFDIPVQGIVRGRWEVCCHEVVADSAPVPPLPPSAGTVLLDQPGRRTVLAPPAERAAYPWDEPLAAAIAREEPLATTREAEEVRARAEALVSARLLDRTTRSAVGGIRISDFAHVNRVEGLALGAGGRVALGGGVALAARARRGFDDAALKGRLEFSVPLLGGRLGFAGGREYREAGDVPEASGVRNSAGAQLAGDDNTDPYDVQGVGLRFTRASGTGTGVEATLSAERQRPLAVRAVPWSGRYGATIPAEPLDAARLAVAVDGRGDGGPLGGPLRWRVEVRGSALRPLDGSADRAVARAAAALEQERRVGGSRLVLATHGAAVTGAAPPQELARLGGWVTAPGYAFHRFAARAAVSQRVELRVPVPFVRIPLPRYGRAPARATLAPYVNLACVAEPAAGPGGCWPSAGAGFAFLYDLVRVDVARGLRDGRWLVGVDAARWLWGVL